MLKPRRGRSPSVEDMFRRIPVGHAGDRAGRDGVLPAPRPMQPAGAPVNVSAGEASTPFFPESRSVVSPVGRHPHGT